MGHRGVAGSSTRDHSPRLPPPASEVLSISTSARPPLLLQGAVAVNDGDRTCSGGRASKACEAQNDRAASGDHAPPCERARRQRTKSSAPSTARRSAPRRSLPIVPVLPNLTLSVWPGAGDAVRRVDVLCAARLVEAVDQA